LVKELHELADQTQMLTGDSRRKRGHFDHFDSGLHCSLHCNFCLDFFAFAAALTINAIQISVVH
jgi:hypothetical protein